MFENMLSKTLIQILWIVMSIGVVIYSVSTGMLIGSFWIFLISLVVGLLGARVWAELSIVIFMMHEHLEQQTALLSRLVNHAESSNRTGVAQARPNYLEYTATRSTSPDASAARPVQSFSAPMPRPSARQPQVEPGPEVASPSSTYKKEEPAGDYHARMTALREARERKQRNLE